MRKHWQQAQEFLSDAHALFQQNRLKSAVDRAYYAMFHAVTAALAMKELLEQAQRFLERVRKVLPKELSSL